MVTPPPESPAQAPPELPAIVAEALARLRFGEIRLAIHNGRVMQVDVTERTRLSDA